MRRSCGNGKKNDSTGRTNNSLCIRPMILQEERVECASIRLQLVQRHTTNNIHRTLRQYLRLPKHSMAPAAMHQSNSSRTTQILSFLVPRKQIRCSMARPERQTPMGCKLHSRLRRHLHPKVYCRRHNPALAVGLCPCQYHCQSPCETVDTTCRHHLHQSIAIHPPQTPHTALQIDAAACHTTQTEIHPDQTSMPHQVLSRHHSPSPRPHRTGVAQTHTRTILCKAQPFRSR